MNMYRQVYQERRTYLRYDDQHIIGYLNEEVLKDYTPENAPEGAEPWPVAYAYTGTETDGGTVMSCTDAADYGQLANAIIRTCYSVSQELAIQRHAINGDYEEAPQEFEEYDRWCRQAVDRAKEWVTARSLLLEGE